MNLRAIAAKAICRVVDNGQTLDAAMAEYLPAVERRDDRGFVKELCFGTLRWFDQLKFFLDRYLSKPLKPRDSDIRTLVLIGLYQLHHLNTPAYAAISETVNATLELDKEWAKAPGQCAAAAFATGVLFTETGTWTDTPARVIPIRTGWLTGSGLIGRNNGKPYYMQTTNGLPSVCGVNELRTLQEKTTWKICGRPGSAHRFVTRLPAQSRYLDPVDVSRLPGFDGGRVSVQDAGAQLAAILLDPQPGNRILDAVCSARRENRPYLRTATGYCRNNGPGH